MGLPWWSCWESAFQCRGRGFGPWSGNWDPTRCRATSLPCRNYWAFMPQLESPCAAPRESVAPNKRPHMMKWRSHVLRLRPSTARYMRLIQHCKSTILHVKNFQNQKKIGVNICQGIVSGLECKICIIILYLLATLLHVSTVTMPRGHRKFICCWWVYKAGSTPGGNLAISFKKHILFNPANPLEGIYPQIFSVYKMHKVLAAAVFTIAKDGKLNVLQWRSN